MQLTKRDAYTSSTVKRNHGEKQPIARREIWRWITDACFVASGLDAHGKTDGIMEWAKFQNISADCLCQEIHIIKISFRLYQSSVIDQLGTNDFDVLAM